MSELHSEIKQLLRKLDFPACAKEALIKIANLICVRAPSIKQMDLALDLMAEFVFYEVDRRGQKRPALTPLMELQLLEVLFDFLNATTNDSSRNSIFLTLFSGTTATQRSGILSKLVSIALCTNSPKILSSASTWMQQLGNTSSNCCRLAESLVQDYFLLLPESTEKLKSLPEKCPQFVANFLTAVAELYFVDNHKHDIKFPPDCLLQIVIFWIKNDHKLCIAAQTMQSHLPQGAIAMEATTPIAGLLRWCILSPIYDFNNDAYAQLHLALLSSINAIPTNNLPRALSTTDLIQSSGQIMKYVLKLEQQQRSDGNVIAKAIYLNENENLQLALIRYAQAIQVSLSVKCLYGNIDDFLNQLGNLPSNKLLNIVVKSYKLAK